MDFQEIERLLNEGRKVEEDLDRIILESESRRKRKWLGRLAPLHLLIVLIMGIGTLAYTFYRQELESIRAPSLAEMYKSGHARASADREDHAITICRDTDHDGECNEGIKIYVDPVLGPQMKAVPYTEEEEDGDFHTR